MRQPLIAVATYVWNESRTLFLVSERLAGKCQGAWNLPGGRLEWMEDPLAGARREVREEVGINAEEFRPVCFDYGENPDEDHCWVVLFFCAWYTRCLPLNPEPDKNKGWLWANPEDPPEKLLLPARRNALVAHAFANTML